ncbi:toluene ABC transporter substrate-binding protein [Photobacterium iliopiscarium]|jgi:phospholipid/cholesterol/gamma-HCH transport system substrate-binding protein|uniref:Outer membrane lipid asymmetry maintenance protein MlaD n=1 Tax=Photobacterium iliopiscarium TaxID=56192 RepID=A0A0D8PVV1_9GAMM|nr:outer membrane lipid asymmetry maintenance protein MlaD [Photobacterium iliopiscarium]KJG12931.1 toluene ABC transporter substrate-binding protein [Photobacterium iliopiscarium]KJG21329.1 toluene ABC transporter substrate-binding protein [Photobacterium iliopiscarium]MCD9466297.1 outer membrane lipid asymmetry maintenance protein MlaD [Photobacterium iliopiscarium]MCD9486044.1 outer membrane lipid asymmetry maintenance protein MlaD [Photobacterium iliopiscarium]MCF2242771.1 outer membrane l
MQQNKRLELWVGVFMLAGISALLVLAFKVANVQSFGSTETYTLKAHFDNIGGLKVRSPVKVGGVTVGEVTSITLDKQTYVPIVTLDVNKKFGYFPETSSASILTSGLLGEQYLGISPGFVDTDTEMLHNGDLIEDTKSALVLEDMIGQVLYSLGGDKK